MCSGIITDNRCNVTAIADCHIRAGGITASSAGGNVQAYEVNATAVVGMRGVHQCGIRAIAKSPVPAVHLAGGSIGGIVKSSRL